MWVGEVGRLRAALPLQRRRHLQFSRWLQFSRRAAWVQRPFRENAFEAIRGQTMKTAMRPDPGLGRSERRWGGFCRG